MYEIDLEELYDFFIEEVEMPSFMEYSEIIDLIPTLSIEYLDKIKGIMVGIGLGDFQTMNTSIVVAESLIICQCFNPEDVVNRLMRQSVDRKKNNTKHSIRNYIRGENKYTRKTMVLDGYEKVLSTEPISIINYGDFDSLRLTAGIQGSIVNKDEMMIAYNIFYSTAIAYLMNIHPFSLNSLDDLYDFVNLCSKSIKGIEKTIYPHGQNQGGRSLYTIVQDEFINAIEENLEIEEMLKKWNDIPQTLKTLFYGLYIFLKSPNDYNKIYENSFLVENNDVVASIALTLAGAYLGFYNISKDYIKKVPNIEEILIISLRLFELSLKNNNNNPYIKRSKSNYPRIYTDEIDKLMWQGVKYNKDGEYEKAIEHFENLISRYNDIQKNKNIKKYIIDAYKGLGIKKLEAEDYGGALKHFKKALAYDLNNPDILCDLAIAYLNLDDLKKAEKYVRRSVELSPEYQIGKEVLDAIISLKK